MIANLCVMIPVTLVAFLAEDKVMAILLMMEMITLLTFFLVLFLNPLGVGLGVSLLVLLTMMISESVLMICLFINILRFYKAEMISSFMALNL